MYRPRISDMDRTIGEETSMGWRVLDIHYLYEGNYYRYPDYMRLVRKATERREPIRKKIAKYLIKQLRKIS